MIPVQSRTPLATLILALLAGVGVVAAAMYVHDKAVTARQQAQRDWAEARSRLAGLPQRIARVHEKRALLAEQQRRGLMGRPRRLEWISALTWAQRAIALDAITWRLEPTRPTVLPGLSVTRMHLGLTPMTPASLGRWLARLDDLGVGLFTVEACDWALTVPPQRMQCVLNWWNLDTGGATR